MERKRKMLNSFKKAIKAIDKEIASCLDEEECIRKNYDLLLSIPGIGHVVALETIILTENFTSITNPRKYACYIGIAPFPKESGTSVRKRTSVSCKGFSQAKANLSLSAIMHNPN